MSQNSDSELDDIDLTDVMDELEDFEGKVSDDDEKSEVRRIRDMLEQVPSSDEITKYTLEDIGEAFVGALVFSLPFLVEGGVFEVADWFSEGFVGPIPLFFIVNLVITVFLTAGLLYAVDIREVKVYNSILGFIPRRLAGHLLTALVCSVFMMVLWGRLYEGDPSTFESVCRVTIVWTPAAMGAVLADVVPGESQGEDISEILD